ncbi:MAG TPA: helicase-related protein [Anaerolineae bacterium]|nr:helicase-related protein [Anaerolineae bacterium]
MPDIRPGHIVQGPRWPEPVDVKLVEDLGDYVHLVGATTGSGEHVDQLIPRGELAQLQIARVETDFAASPRQVFLGLEARRYRFASLYDPLLAMNTSKVDPLPHQIEAVYGYVLRLPRIRFLIADDPGVGKTIMAGLVIKELKLRHLARRILIVVPGHLKDQWRREMKERFEENFVVIDRGVIDALYSENVWQREMQIITSMDFAKQDDLLPSLASTHFDLVIVDEAHKMSAYVYGNKLERTSRYRLGEVLSRCTTHLLFLTATPHKGDPENFRLFLDLLEPGFFATTAMLAESIRNQDNPLFIRRVKEDMKDFEGKPLFLPRYVETITFDLGRESVPEKDLYNALSRYVKVQYNRALTRDRRRNVAFALVILQRRLASSTYALYRSLERRKKRLEDILQEAQKGAQELHRPGAGSLDFDAVEDLSEEERWRQEEIWETLSVAENRQELEREIQIVETLIQQARAIIQGGEEVKLRHFREALDDLNRQHPGAKILVFTEARDTLEYLEKRIREWGYSICTIHGGMRLEERVQAEGIFKNEAQVMVATEAAGEGINLQFCNLMINYDIPWNPNRLEQRMGRVHRYGQTKEVFVFNLVAGDTREGQVLVRLFAKLQEIRNALGNDKVFDVLGEVLYGKNLAQLLLEAAASARSMDEILAELDVEVDDEYIARVKENLGESLATHYIDYTRIQEMADRAREHRLIPEYTQAFFQKAMEAAGGDGAKVRDRGGGFLAVDAIPFEVRRIAQEDDFKKRHGSLQHRYPMVSFDKEIARWHARAEFVSFGHPLFEALLAWVERELTGALSRGAVFTDPDGRMDGVLLFYEGNVQDGLGQVAGRRLFALYADLATGETHPANPALLWDMAEGGEPSDGPSPDLEAIKQRCLSALLPVLAEYREKLQAERDHQAGIKEKYGVKSLDHLILRLDGDLIGLYDRRERGDKVDLPIHNKEEQKRDYEEALVILQRTVAQERSLTMGMPRFVGAVRVVPASQADVVVEMVEDADIERVGMEVTMDYEREQGRVPEDVAAENLGFDVRSTDPETDQKRYIEVKARSKVGPVALTQNEWFKASRFSSEFYLYVVLNAASQPQLYIIQDPASNLQPEERVEVRYLVPVGDITGKGEKV